MRAPLLLYSAQTWLAYSIAEQFYGGTHFAWCSPVYDAATAGRHVNIPPTSSPAEIYRNLQDEVRRGERHSLVIEKNRAGIRKGAQARLREGMISEAAKREIEAITKNAETLDFRPVLFVMPFERVKDDARVVPVRNRAHPMSVEYIVERLSGTCFDMLELRS
jgi:hypothetical protein